MKRLRDHLPPALALLAALAACLAAVPAGARGGWGPAGCGPAGCAAVAAPAFQPTFQPTFQPAFAPAFRPALLPGVALAPPAPTHATTPAVTTPGYSWTGDGAGGHGLFLGEAQVGWLDPAGRYYPRLGRGVFGGECEPPHARPEGSLAPRARVKVSEPGDCASAGASRPGAQARPPIGERAGERGGERGACCGASGCRCEPDDCQCGRTRGLCCDGCSCAIFTSGKVDFLTPPERNFGVETDKLGKGPSWRINGREVSRARAFEAVSSPAGDGRIPDDAGKVRFTVIGPKGDRERVVKDLDSHPALAPFRPRLSVQAYDPADPLLEGMKFPTSGLSLVLQRPDGTVIGRNHSGKYPGAEELAQAMPGALRRVDDGYDPAKDPDLKKPEPKPDPAPPAPPAPAPPAPGPAVPPWLSAVPPQAWLLGGLGSLLLILTLTRRNTP